MTNIPTSDASNATTDSATVGTGSLFTDSDSSNTTAELATVFPYTGSTGPEGFAAAIPGYLPGSFTTDGLFYTNHAGASFYLSSFPAGLPNTLPFSLCNFVGPSSGPLSPNYVTNVGYELRVFSGNSYTFMTVIPRYESLSFNIELSDEGSGQLVIDRSDPIFSSTLATGGPGTDLLDYENFWQCLYNGTPVFEFLGTTIAEVIVDASSETQPITISGAGTARCLQWGQALPPGFPNVVYSLAAIADTFQVSAIDQTTWNLTTVEDLTSGLVSVDIDESAAAIAGVYGNTTVAPALAGGYYNAQSSALSALITPLNMPVQAVNLVTNGDFLLGTEGWTTGPNGAQSAGASAVSYTMDSFDGSGFCAQVTTTGAHQGISQTITSLAPSTYYQFNAWVKQQAPATYHLHPLGGLRIYINPTSGPSTPVLVLCDSTNSIVSYPSSGGITQVGDWCLLTATILTGPTTNVSVICAVTSGTSAVPNQFLVDTTNFFSYTPDTSTAMSLYQEGNLASSVSMELDMGSGFIGRCLTNGIETDTYLSTTGTVAVYDPVQHAYWRIREFNGSFYFDTAPDGATWTNQGSIAHTWPVSEVSVAFSSWWYGQNAPTPSPPFSPMFVSSINTSGVSALSAQGNEEASVNQGSLSGYNVNSGSPGLNNAYIELPNMAIWLDLLNQSQSRGTIPFVLPTFTAVADSAGIAWTDQASLTVSNGADLETQLEASASAVGADWIMQPFFQLYAGNPGSLGNDNSGTVVFYSSGQIVSHDRTRVRDQISNYVVASDSSGNLTYQTSPSSEAQWNQREQFVQSSQATDIATLAQMANAALLEFQDEVSQRTLSVPPSLPGRTLFEDYTVSDYIGVQNPDLLSVDKVRVVGAAVSIDGTQDLVTVELTLETRIQLLIEKMNVLLQKIGSTADAQVLAAPGAVSQFISQTLNQSVSGSYTQFIGDGVNTAFYIAHGLNSQDVTISVRNTVTGLQAQQVQTPTAGGQYAVTIISPNQVEILFYASVIPSIGEYSVAIKN